MSRKDGVMQLVLHIEIGRNRNLTDWKNMIYSMKTDESRKDSKKDQEATLDIKMNLARRVNDRICEVKS